MMRSVLLTATITAIGVAYHAVGCNRNSPGTGWRHNVLPVWSHGLSLLVYSGGEVLMGSMFGALHCWVVGINMFQQAQSTQNIRVVD